MAMQMNSLVHASTSPSTTSAQAKKHQETAEHVAVHVVDDGGDDGGASDDAGVDCAVRARAQWLRAAVLGASDGLVSVASLMLGVGAVNESGRAMLVSGLAGLVAGACSMAIGEYVSVYAQRDIEETHLTRRDGGGEGEEEDEEALLPSPVKAAAASSLAFGAGAALPLLSSGFVRPWSARVGVVGAVTTAGLAGFGAAGAVLGGASPGSSAARVLVGGWAAMALCYGVLRLFSLAFGTQVSAP